jgi:hypothetical protein
MPRKDGRPRHLPPFEPSATCYYGVGVCPFHGVEHEFTTKEEDNETAPSRPGRRG